MYEGRATNAAGSDAAVAYQGRPGAFGEAAARSVAGAGRPLLPCPTFEAVVGALAGGQVSRAVLPVVNTVAGGVGEALDLVATRTDTAVVGAVTVPVAMALVAPPGVAFGSIRRVRSHPVALAQCRAFFRAHPHLDPVVDFDTAGAVEAVVAAGRADEAALGSVHAARVYGGCLLLEGLQDHPRNATRFLVLARSTEQASQPPDTPRHALAVWTGADADLGSALMRLAGSGWHLCHLERRPASEDDSRVGRFVMDLAQDAARARSSRNPSAHAPARELGAPEIATTAFEVGLDVPGLVLRGLYVEPVPALDSAM